MCITIVFQVIYHVRNVLLCIGLTHPQIEMNVEVSIVLFQIGNRNIHNVFPDRTVASSALLQLSRCLECTFLIVLVLFRFAACARINLLEFADRKRCFLRVLSRKGLIKINKLRMALLQLGDDQSHLQTPVSKMNVTDHVVAHEASHTLDALADDRGTEMADVKRFCHVCSAVIYDDGFRIFCFLYRKIFIVLHFGKIICQKFRVDFQVDKSRFYGFNFTDHAVIGHFFYNCFSQLDRCFVVCFCSCHCAVALVFAQIRAVGNGNPCIGRVHLRSGKGFYQLFLDKIDQFFHNVSLIFFFTAESSVLRFVSARCAGLLPLL